MGTQHRTYTQSWPGAMIQGHGLGSLLGARGHRPVPWPGGTARGFGPVLRGFGPVPRPWAMAQGHGPGPWPRATARAHGPGPRPRVSAVALAIVGGSLSRIDICSAQPSVSKYYHDPFQIQSKFNCIGKHYGLEVPGGVGSSRKVIKGYSGQVF